MRPFVKPPTRLRLLGLRRTHAHALTQAGQPVSVATWTRDVARRCEVCATFCASDLRARRRCSACHRRPSRAARVLSSAACSAPPRPWRTAAKLPAMVGGKPGAASDAAFRITITSTAMDALVEVRMASATSPTRRLAGPFVPDATGGVWPLLWDRLAPVYRLDGQRASWLIEGGRAAVVDVRKLRIFTEGVQKA